MSATPVASFIKDIAQKKVKAVQDRLVKNKEKPNQRYSDPNCQGAVYTLLHKAVEVGEEQIVVALLKAGADVQAQDNTGASPLHWAARYQTPSHLKITSKHSFRFQHAAGPHYTGYLFMPS